MRIRQRLETLHAHPHFQVVLRIVETLEAQGYATVLAGGCVRDGLLHRIPKDLDVATAAPPEVVEKSFKRTLAVGKAFGTIVVIEDGLNFEVTTFRKDGPYVDGRHPVKVEFSDMHEDARRRDFTVNAMFYDVRKDEVIDFVGGIKDLKAQTLRTVGVAAERFQEDRLRMLRAARFVAQLGFQLNSETLQAIKKDHMALKEVSSERVFNEMKRMLESPSIISGIEVLVESQLSKVVWPEIEKVDLELLASFTPFFDWENAYAALMLILSAKDIETRLRAWKVPRESMKRIQAQIEGLKILLNPKSGRADRALILGGDEFAEVLLLARGFLRGNIDLIQGWIKDYLKMTGQAGLLPKPLLNGQDLIAAGIEPGEKMGLLLKALYQEQLEGNFFSKAEALEKLKEFTA